MRLQPIILCGGSGTRLWPLSREQYPKQLLALAGEGDTLLQATARRISGSSMGEHKILGPIVVANEDYRFIAAEQLRQAGVVPAAIVLEPVGRNTAPALTLAALVALQAGDDAVLVVMPADHVITDADAFRSAVTHGAAHAEAGKFVTFGIQPDRPETGYGYIRRGKPLGGPGSAGEIDAFVEKPDAVTAERYIASREYLWNSGIFVLRAAVWLKQLKALRPDMVQACTAAFAARSPDRDFLRVGKEAFAGCPGDSIDFAVMEKLPSGLGVVIPLEAGWSDVGAWDAFWNLRGKDAENNVLHGDVMAVATHDTLAISQSRLVALVGVSEAVVIETPDAVLVAHKDEMQRVKDLVAQLKREGRSEAQAHRKVHRPWGYYDSIDAGNRFQVKRIVVNPGAA
ncbi:MAG: mannose-1-phosphate guanylyltransferase/mannose-6-phosphate isomerase, partial [Hyphomicrobiaceae bacterium]